MTGPLDRILEEGETKPLPPPNPINLRNVVDAGIFVMYLMDLNLTGQREGYLKAAGLKLSTAPILNHTIGRVEDMNGNKIAFTIYNGEVGEVATSWAS